MKLQTIVTILQYALGVAFFALTLAAVYLTIKRWDPALRRAVARHFGVEIDISGKGQWQVVSDLSWFKKFAIEMIQLAFFIFLFICWAIAAIALTVGYTLLDRLLAI